MKCGWAILLAVVVTFILTILITLILAWLFFSFYLKILERRAMNNYNQIVAQTCESASLIPYVGPVVVPTLRTRYEVSLALPLMQVCANVGISNCPNIGILPPPPPFTNFQQLQGPNPSGGAIHNFGYIFWNTNTAMFVFTGTFFFDEWQDDFNTKQVAPTTLNNYAPGVLVHGGFYGVYSVVRPALVAWYNANPGPANTLIITGHSLGGAVATICGYDFALVNSRIVTYTFAAPRSGNSLYADIYNDNLPNALRVNNTEDIIPALPPSTWQDQTYEHVGNNVPFTVALSSLAENHNDAYLNYLPTCFPNSAPCPL